MIDRSVVTRTSLSGVFFLLLLGGSVGLQYQPVEINAGGEDCALVLNGPGRTSSFDYTLNLLRGSFPSSVGGQSCITYEAINHAYLEARKRIRVAQPKTEIWKPEELATVGELLLDISTQIAHMYGLSYEEIEKSLPLMDTSKTLIHEVCPAYLSDVECRPGKYRRYDGLCTNLENPTWGASLSPFVRLMSPRFSDGMSSPRIATSGRNLPLSRVVSRTMHPDEGYHDHAGTVMVIAWGQFMDHDYTLTATPLDAFNRNDPEECCNRPPHQKHPYCNEILIPEDDYFYRLFNVRCMDFVRAFPGVRPGCRLGSRVPFNLLTGVLDGNTVYGVTDAHARKLRTGYAGLLRMNPVFSEYGLKDLLPLKLDIPDEGCTRPNQSMYCFEAGEIRVNEQLVLACMHTLMAREHNRAAKALAKVNPHWDDETLFQEARRIVIAQIQHVTYNEFLPILLGKDVMEKFGLLLEKDRYWDGYDSNVNPGVIDAFASAAFRFGHSLLPTAVERWSKAHKFIASKRLSDLIRRPYDLYRAGVLDEYFMGLMNQVAQAMDDSITQEVTNHLFKKVGAKFGMDLVSFNMQRGREFGIPSYMEFRKFCGLPGADTFDELFGSMPNETIRRYSSIFENPSDVDLWSGGVSERPLPGSMLGPTFACVIATQFSNSRRGDRFWYELPNQPSSFTLDQLNEIRKGRLARLICDNTDLIDTIQIYPMVLPDHEINPRVPCRSGILPGIDFSKWAEFPTNGGAPYDGKHEPSTSERKPIYSKFTRNNLDTTEKKNSQKIKTFNLKVENSPINSLSPKTEIKLDLENQSPIEALRITTIIEIMREKGKAKETSTKKRSKRETSTLLSIAVKPRNNSTFGSTYKPQLEKLYRHPRLTSKEQKLSATKMNSPLDVGFKDNLKVFETKLGSQEINVPHPFSFLAPSLALVAYNDTASSEVDDLNMPPPRPIKRKTVIPVVDIKFPLSPTKPPKALKIKSFNSKQDLGAVGPRSFQSSSIPLVQETKNTTYINLEDHRKDLNEGNLERQTVPGYPPDIPPYNPDIIPYVEVPDYSDRREESLDKDDQLIAKKKFKDYDDQDFVDPTAPLSAGKNKELDEVKRTEKPKSSAQTPYIEIQDNKPIKDVDSKKLEAIPVHESEESEVDTQEPSEESKAKEESAEDLEPINFDINDYKKPFNFKELFKELNLPLDDEDDDQKEEKEEAEGTYSEKYVDPTQKSSTTEGYTSFEHLYDNDNENENENENENSTETEAEVETEDDDTSGDTKTVKISEDEFKYGDKDFFKPFFGEKAKRSSHEFYYDGDRKKNGRREASNRKNVLAKGYAIDEEKLLPLSDILAKKNSFSRLSKNVDKDVKKSGKVPREYKNEWVLKYEFPKKKEEEERT